MKILVYGAGIIGTLYASRLQEAGHQVTVLARASRLVDIRRHGLVLEDVVSGARSITQVNVTERLSPEDRFDMALISVRWDQLQGVLPELAANHGTPTVLFMLNNPSGSTGLVDALGVGRVLLGFPGAGGTLQDHVVRYIIISKQPTTIGEPEGGRSTRLHALVETLRASGFPTGMVSHAFFVTAVSGAIYLAGGDCERLSRSRAFLSLMVSGVRERFSAVRILRQPVHPFALKVLFSWLPRPFAAYYWRRFFSNRMAEYAFAGHVRHASAEIRALAAECRLLVGQSGVAAPALTQLYRAIDEYAATQARR
jgi:2-dehydropantoate 2-reductase